MKMLERLLKIFICLTLSLISIAFQPVNITVNAETKGIINVSNLNLREGPGLSYNVKTQLKKGELYTIISKGNDWVQIKLQDGNSGWIYGKYVEFPNNEKAEQNIENGEVSANILNIRETPSIDSHIIGKLKKGTVVTIVSMQDKWLNVKFNNIEGWVFKEYLKKTNTSEINSNEKQLLEEGSITATVLNVRDQGSLNGKVIAQVTKGKIVKIIKEENNWFQIVLANNLKGWVASWFVEISKQKPNNNSTQQINDEAVITILYNGTNIRNGPSTTNKIIKRVNTGETFPVISIDGKWYKIQLPNKQIGYVAGWIVQSPNQSPRIEHTGIEKNLLGKTIVIDPGHGGRDSGTIGATGSLEKDLTMRTAKLVYDKLKALGVNAILTRSNDNYITLRNRVATSHYHHADAFISIHYNSSLFPSIRGTSTYYYHEKNKNLAQNMQNMIVENTGFSDRKIHYGNYQVLRENKQAAILLELGFLSNRSEEFMMLTDSYQEKAANAIYYGLAQYFKK